VQDRIPQSNVFGVSPPLGMSRDIRARACRAGAEHYL
jgi:hypothetical protein